MSALVKMDYEQDICIYVDVRIWGSVGPLMCASQGGRAICENINAISRIKPKTLMENRHWQGSFGFESLTLSWDYN